MFFVLPVGIERPVKHRPTVTYWLIGINFLAYIYTFFLSGDPEWVIWKYGLVLSSPTVLTFFTSMFLHGGLWHLLGNMLFLYLYGGNVEDRLGKVRYILLYFVGGLAADALHMAVTSGGARDGRPNGGGFGGDLGHVGCFSLELSAG